MYITIFMFMLLLINIMFTIMIHPLTSTLLIIIQTIIICIIMSSNLYSFWFSYILFMIFLGGMLVLFIYLTSLASNEMFFLPMKTMMIMTLMLIISTMMMNKMNYMKYNMNIKNDYLMSSIIMNMSTEMPMNITQLYNMPNMNLTILTIMYLLITLIIIVKITQIYEGPLRQLMN
uniref:NADH-ubiquinone oxidoreductase chain 6 n=1 Tax=Cardiodactylus muiri TaxID=2184234 RepID=A0A343XAN6_9ORTH|nr:NADH dehydrogenase subunit 6 [Cardiodactylus muiri]AWI49117.1 NADH dehydrogenase subunit 6 [Cardiodactylus muiri]